jgi:hypothetical protein
MKAAPPITRQNATRRAVIPTAPDPTGCPNTTMPPRIAARLAANGRDRDDLHGDTELQADELSRCNSGVVLRAAPGRRCGRGHTKVHPWKRSGAPHLKVSARPRTSPHGPGRPTIEEVPMFGAIRSWHRPTTLITRVTAGLPALAHPHRKRRRRVGAAAIVRATAGLGSRARQPPVTDRAGNGLNRWQSTFSSITTR